MKILTTIQATQEWLKEGRIHNQTIAFVPTMGALHDGHTALIRQAKLENNIVIASIFVNPLQFNNKQDLEKYPRTPSTDIEKLKEAGCNAAFVPPTEEIYPSGKENPTLIIDLGIIDKVMEGAHRPGHFKGVCIVVKKLFDIIHPTNAYFGEKDFQQIAVIKTMVRTLDIPVKIISVPTVRENDGLAMSSRNIRLNIEERRNAPLIYQTLIESKRLNFSDVKDIKYWAEQKINSNPYLKLEYFEIVNRETLEPLNKITPGTKSQACIAVTVNDVRLIDNIAFN